MRIPRIIISGANSGAGKTTITTGIIGALTNRGITVQGFKVGPDYIDPTYHTAVSGQASKNLDSWMLPQSTILELFLRSAQRSDVSVIEGVMGLFDGLSGVDETGSTAQLAKILDCPVVLIIDAWGMARSAAAVALGYVQLDPKVRIAAVILNRVANEKHAASCREAIEEATKLPVIGAIPSNSSIRLPERHLGLVPTVERKELQSRLESVVSFVREHVDLDQLVKVANSAPELHKPQPHIANASEMGGPIISVAMDEAFNFYYRDSLDILEGAGAQLAFFSPIHDKQLPTGTSGLYIGGGFPEVLAAKLAANEQMLRAVKDAVEDCMPVYGECGGLMYLTKAITDFEGKSCRMVGVLEGETIMTRSLCLSYTDAHITRSNLLASEGESIRGHEFHYSRVTNIPSDATLAYEMRRGVGIDGKRDGWVQYRTLASYMHTHFAGDSKRAKRFVEAAREYSCR